MDPRSSAPPPPPLPPPPMLPRKTPVVGGSLAAGVGLAWLIMIVGEFALPMTGYYGNFLGAMPGLILLPPLAIAVWGIVLLNGDKPRKGKGLLLGLLSIFAVALLLVAACFGMLLGYH